jgi:hypothetical protein
MTGRGWHPWIRSETLSLSLDNPPRSCVHGRTDPVNADRLWDVSMRLIDSASRKLSAEATA